MGESDEKKKISENMMELVDLITNLDDVVKYLRERDVLTEEEEREVAAQDAPFNKKSHLIWLIKQKEDDQAVTHFTAAVRATGNDVAADKLDSSPSSPSNHIEADVTVVESHPPPAPQPDQEGMALAVEIEQEFDRIQSGMDKEKEEEHETEVGNPNSDQEQGHLQDNEEGVEGQGQHEGHEDQESDVRVEITAPTESEPEAEEEDAVVVENGDEKHDEIEEEGSSPSSPPPVESSPPPPESPKPHKQVTFGGEVTEEREEFVLHGDKDDDTSGGDRKSIVAMNREKFEKPSSPNGESAPKVKYSFGKKGGVAAGAPKEEEPKESTVKNLRNFFQKLGSIDAEEGSVLKRGGVRQGGSQNRRTMI
ncbi:uncharacterized protein LOC110859125 isoform X1 [Folsomia candida]|uniref:CARD domain-containing protein n=1 Tax=Folsomia candida TaxID=158441 RepID=A0A226DBH0_FOLCA|nr:uncharacterized protein LOC110859125 isoform X1 [Folsomia candida]XP_035715122.1 uncharacterized protein LOC110859125 isoform X1 [Folsomia candida]XP_035715123.1 uncharacterized protein LOC110859125 isoform X1 [Folsomia candida]OXA42895.1 hypothetical protein Fcan01_22330 [Folsomia candida]